MNWKDFFYFSHREKQGLLVLLVLLIGIAFGKLLFGKPESLPQEPLVETFSRADSSDSPPMQNVIPEPQRQEKKQTSPMESKQTYKEKPAEKPESRTYYVREKSEVASGSQTPFPKTEKLQEGMTVDINRADSVMLCKIPGIGPAFSRRIIAFRNLLGGYHRLEQLQDVYGMYEELYEKILPFIEINADSLRQIPVNSSSLDKLRLHPYINFYQAKAIVELRKRSGKLKNMDELILLEEFTDEDMERIKPYLNFDYD